MTELSLYKNLTPERTYYSCRGQLFEDQKENNQNEIKSPLIELILLYSPFFFNIKEGMLRFIESSFNHDLFNFGTQRPFPLYSFHFFSLDEKPFLEQLGKLKIFTLIHINLFFFWWWLTSWSNFIEFWSFFLSLLH